MSATVSVRRRRPALELAQPAEECEHPRAGQDCGRSCAHEPDGPGLEWRRFRHRTQALWPVCRTLPAERSTMVRYKLPGLTRPRSDGRIAGDRRVGSRVTAGSDTCDAADAAR